MPLTRLAPSRLVPGCKGVFLTRPLKKLTPVELAPAPDAVAPPYVENVAFAPMHTISLRRFLALRHQFSTSQYFNVATSHGWYFVAPSSYAPLTDTAGLHAWCERHHHRYQRSTSIHPTNSLRETVETGRRTSSEVEGMENDANPEEVEEEDEVEEGYEEKERTRDPNASHHRMPRRGRRRPSSAVTPITIAEEHLFEINDGVLWQLPPRDDLACGNYWKEHRERMRVYEDTSVSTEQEELFLGPEALSDSGNAEVNALTQRERYTQRYQLFRALTQKANVKLSVDDDTGLLTLVPIMDLRDGEELLLHYGREWWSQRLLSNLFLSVNDNQMRDVRWIEALFAKPTDVSQPFPLLCPAMARRKERKGTTKLNPKRKREKEEKNVESDADTLEENNGHVKGVGHLGKLVLYNVLTQRQATDTEVLMFAVRRSCIDRDFFARLVNGGDHVGNGPSTLRVFDVSRYDDKVPMRQLRRALLFTLHQKREGDDAEQKSYESGTEEESDGFLVL